MLEITFEKKYKVNHFSSKIEKSDRDIKITALIMSLKSVEHTGAVSDGDLREIAGDLYKASVSLYKPDRPYRSLWGFFTGKPKLVNVDWYPLKRSDS